MSGTRLGDSRGDDPADRPPSSAAAALPPLGPLLEVSGRLRAAGIEFALGGSGLLHALGLAARVGDWDLTTDAAPEAVDRALAGLAGERTGASGVHADSKLRLHDGTVEVIVRMAFHSRRGICRVPTLPRGEWRSVPLASPEAWAVAYWLLDRAAKAELLLGYLERTGAGPEAVRRLLAEPLPDALAGRLGALPPPGGPTGD